MEDTSCVWIGEVPTTITGYGNTVSTQLLVSRYHSMTDRLITA